MDGHQVCPNCGMTVGINIETCDVCRMYETGRKNARLYPMVALVACWALVPLFTGLLLGYFGDHGKKASLNKKVTATAPEITTVDFPEKIYLGQWINIHIEVRNTGMPAYGFLKVAIPAFTKKGDESNIRLISCSRGDLPGFNRQSANSPVQHKNGLPMKTSACVLSFADFAWRIGETNIVEFQVKPQKTGNFTFLVTAALGSFGEAWSEAGSPAKGLDGQGWTRDAYVVKVLGE